MNVITRRVATTAGLLAAPALIALGTATMSHADTSITNNGPSISRPAHHEAFPNQHNTPQPGTSIHHHHQNHR